MPPSGAAASHSEEPGLTDASLREELVDELDESAVSWELLTGWAELEAREARVLAATKARPQPVPGRVREAALRFLHALAETLGLKQSGWLDAVLLFDRYCLSGSALHVGSLPELCVAVATLVKKVGGSGSTIKTATLTKLATQYAHWLAGMGLARGARCVLEEHVESQEKVILAALAWSVSVPSAHMWLGVLCKRFDILTRGMSTATLDWVNSRGVASAGMLVMRQVAFVRMTPRAMANGLFCTFLTAAAVVPTEALRPAKLTEQEWEELLSESQCRGAWQSGGGRPASQSLLGLLQVVAGCGLPVLQADTHAVVSAMRDVAVALRSQGLHCAPQRAEVSKAACKAAGQHGKSRSGRAGAQAGAGPPPCGRP